MYVYPNPLKILRLYSSVKIKSPVRECRGSYTRTLIQFRREKQGVYQKIETSIQVGSQFLTKKTKPAVFYHEGLLISSTIHGVDLLLDTWWNTWASNHYLIWLTFIPFKFFHHLLTLFLPWHYYLQCFQTNPSSKKCVHQAEPSYLKYTPFSLQTKFRKESHCVRRNVEKAQPKEIKAIKEGRNNKAKHIKTLYGKTMKWRGKNQWEI